MTRHEEKPWAMSARSHPPRSRSFPKQQAVPAGALVFEALESRLMLNATVAAAETPEAHATASSVVARTELPPTAPSHVQASEGRYATAVLVTWNPSPEAASYELWRSSSDDPGSAVLVVEGITDHWCMDVPTVLGETSYYWVKAANSGGHSELSSSASGYADDGYEQNDTFLTAAEINEGTITGLSSYDADHYRIYLSEGEVLAASVAEGLDFSIYDPNQVLLVTSGSGGPAPSAEWTATAAGWYRVYVPEQGLDTYSLTIDVQPLGEVLGITAVELGLSCDYGQPGEADDSYRFYVEVRGDGLRRLQVMTPWGGAFDTSMHLPENWNGDRVEKRWGFDGGHCEILARSGDSGEDILSVDWLGSSPAQWAAWDVNSVELAVETYVGNWAGTASLAAAALPTQRPIVTHPTHDQMGVPVRPSIRWEAWAAAPPTGKISLALLDDANRWQDSIALPPDATDYDLADPLEIQTAHGILLAFSDSATAPLYGVAVRVSTEASGRSRFLTRAGVPGVDPDVVAVGVGQARSVSYTEPDGTLVRLALRGGVATLHYDSLGKPLHVVHGRRGATIVGPVKLTGIALDNTSASSRLWFRTRGGSEAGATVGSVIGRRPLGRLLGRAIDLSGRGICMVGDGYVGSIQLRDIADGATITMAGTPGAKGIRIKAGKLGANTHIELRPHLEALTAAHWAGGSSSLTAPWVSSICVRGDRRRKIAGDFGADLEITGQDRRGISLARLYVAGRIVGSAITAGSGSVDSIRAAQWDAGSLDASWVGRIVITGNRRDPGINGDFGAHVNLTGHNHRGVSLGRLSVAGTVRNSAVSASGSMGTITLGAAQGSDFRAGISDAVARHAESHDDFQGTLAAIRHVKIRGIRGSSGRLLADSNFSAASFGTIGILNVDFANGECGIYARDADDDREISRVRYRDTETGERWSWPPRRNRVFSGPDEFIWIL